MPVLTYFTNPYHQAGSIESYDADVMESLLQTMDLTRGLALVISSPGGDGLAAERIYGVCRSYSGTGKFAALVPGKAKSAATMICMAADEIIMGPTSELGPVDPQVPRGEGNSAQWYSVYNIVTSYQTLFDSAQKAQGNLEPFLQALSQYDAQEIQEFKSALALSDDIAIKALASGMMTSLDEQAIKDRIKVFLEPSTKKVHGRAIHRQEAKDCGLNVRFWEVGSPEWESLYELYLRTNLFLYAQASKIIETAADSWSAPR